MSIEEFIIMVFCVIDDEFKKMKKEKDLRQRGRKPDLSYSEVIAMEVVGESLGLDCDKKIWAYFKKEWLHFFPNIPDRTNFAKQAANLHVVKRLLQQGLAKALGVLTDSLHMIDGFPMPVCKFARAFFSRIFKGQATYGYCATKKEPYYGFHGHLVISSMGVITEATMTPANVDERNVCPELVEGLQGLLLGDKGFIRPLLEEELTLQHLHIETPLRNNMKETRPKAFVGWIKSTRRLIETVIGQLSERFHIEKIWARDMWHQVSRFWRKLLAHTVCIWLNLSIGNEPLQFERLIL